MVDCKACGAWFSSAAPHELCPTCERALKRLDGYAVPVVFCKDCARRKKGYCTIRKDSWGATLRVGEHDYCSDGERRTDNG